MKTMKKPSSRGASARADGAGLEKRPTKTQSVKGETEKPEAIEKVSKIGFGELRTLPTLTIKW